MSSPTPQGPRNIRILKREPGQIDALKPRTEPTGSRASCEVPPGTTTEEDYAKARALIFGEEESDAQEPAADSEPQRPAARSTGKAQYRGCDNSEFDPDYQRIPPTYVPDHYAPESAQRQVWDSRFPPLNQVPNPTAHQRPPHPRNP